MIRMLNIFRVAHASSYKCVYVHDMLAEAENVQVCEHLYACMHAPTYVELPGEQTWPACVAQIVKVHTMCELMFEHSGRL